MLDDAVPGARATGNGRSRSDAEMRRITAAVITSALGTWSYNVAIAVYAYQVTGSTAWVAAATVGRYVPALLIASLGTRLTTRLPRRGVAIGSDLICALSMVLLTALALQGGSLVLAIALASVSSGVARVQAAATMSLAADVVVESELVKRMALIGTSEAIATAVGPAIASAVLLVAEPQWLFLLNAVSFLASAVLLLGVRPRVRTAAAREGVARPADRGAYATARATVRPLLAVRMIVAFIYGADIVILAVVATENLRSETTGYGWLLAAAGAGGLLATFWLRRTDGGDRIRGAITVGTILYALPLAVFVLSPGLVASLTTQAVRGVGMVVVVTLVVTALQRSVPSELSHEVFGQTHSLALVGTVAGSLAAPLLLSWVGLDGALLILALVPLLVLLALQPRLAWFDRISGFTSAALDPVVSTLRGLALFQDASRWTLIELADRLEPIGAEPGREVVRQGEPADALYVLVEGEVEVVADAGSGPVVLRTMAAPAYFGEIGVLSRVPRTATVTATSRATLWRIPAEVFLDAASQAGVSSALSDSARVRLSNTPGTRAALDV